MSAPEGSLTLHGFVLIPEHLEILASLQERYYAAEAEVPKARPVVKAGIQREARSCIQAHQEKKEGKKLSTNQKTALSKAVEKWFTLFCKKRTSKEKIGTRNYSGRDVFRMENGKEIEDLVAKMLLEEGAGRERYVEFYQKALSNMMKDLSEEELQDYAAKAVVWSNMGPPYEIRLERGKDIYHQRSHAHARDMYRQGLIRMFTYIAWQTADGEIWTSKLDFNNEFDAVPRFLDLKKEELEASGMDALWNDYVMTVYPTDGGDTHRQPQTKGTRKARLLLDLNQYGEPILPNPNQPPFGLKGRPWRVDLARAYFSHWYGRAKGAVSPNVTVPWSKIIPRLPDFVAPIYLPSNLVKGFLEPSAMIDEDVLAVLEYIYARQEAGEDPPFEFHQYIGESGKVLARNARKVLKDSDLKVILGSSNLQVGDGEENEERKSKKRKGKGKSKGKGKAKETEREQEYEDPEKARLSAGPSKTNGKGKGKTSRRRQSKGKARQTAPTSDGEYIDIGNVSETSTQPGPSKPGPSLPQAKPRSVSGSSNRSIQSDASSDAPRPPTPTLVWSKAKGKQVQTSKSASTGRISSPATQEPAAQTPPPVTGRTSSPAKQEPAAQTPPPVTGRTSSPAKQEPAAQTPPPASAPFLQANPSRPNHGQSEGNEVFAFGSPDASQNFTFQPPQPPSVPQMNAVVHKTAQLEHEAQFVDLRVQSHSGNRYTLGSSPTPAPKSIQRFTFKPPIVVIPPLASVAQSSSSQVSTVDREDDDLSGYIPGPKSRWKKKGSEKKGSGSGGDDSTSSRDRVRASGDGGHRGSGNRGDSESTQPPKKKQKLGGEGRLFTISETEETGVDNQDRGVNGRGRPKPRPRVVEPTNGDAFDLSRKGRTKDRTAETPRRNTSTRSFAGPSSSTRSKTSMRNRR